MTLQKITAELDEVSGFGSRVETGPLQINDDWPGLFIRGDNAFHYAAHLAVVLERINVEDNSTTFSSAIIHGLLDDLLSCDTHNLKGDDDD